MIKITELVTHMKCECGHENEIVLLFELEQDCKEKIKCMNCGFEFERKVLVPYAKKVIKNIFNDKDNFRKYCNNDNIYISEIKRYKQLLKDM